MATELPLVFFHSPSTRSTGVLILLEGLSAPYSLHLLNMQNSEPKAAAFLVLWGTSARLDGGVWFAARIIGC